ncbi:glycosyltransferase [Marisediminicola senii]|uniref:glycosyltransferase n=1 Tax=Marisediminicola senii TaxID=2711233 RepID=UPI0013EE227E|nr:glycosyltransferase [Marisediminicola senii]
MHVLIVANDTRGGVEPYAHLAAGLRTAGHSVRVAAPAEYAPMFAGVTAFHGLTGAGRADTEAAAREKLSLRAIGALVTERARGWARETREIADGVDLVCAGIGGAMIAGPVAQSVGAPFVRTHLQPIDAPSFRYPGLLTPWLSYFGSAGNLAGNAVSGAVLRTAFGPPLRAARTELGLPRRHAAPHSTILYGFSPRVVPVASSSTTRRVATGYWTGAAEEVHDPELERFLAGPAPVVSIGFGSMRSADPDALRSTVLEAVRMAGVRAVLLSGWGAIAGDDHAGEHVFGTESLPHSWLFRRVSATVHHGGAGTAGAALLSGVPSVVVPFGAEQPFWAARTRSLGVSPPPVPIKGITAERLAAAIRMSIGSPVMRSRARSLAAELRDERGVVTAVRELELIAR